MINLEKPAQQQINQRALNTKIKILKQTHDINITESLLPITKKLEQVDKFTKESGKILKWTNSEDETPQLAIEIVRNDIQSGVLYNTSLENTLTNVKKQKGFSSIDEGPNGDIFWINVCIEILGDSSLKIDNDVYDTSENLQNVFTIIPDKPLKMLNGIDRVQYQNLLKSLNFIDYIPKPG